MKRYPRDMRGHGPDAPAAGLAVSLAYATNLETFARVFSRPKVHAHLYEAQARGSAGLLRLMARFGLPLDPAHDLVFEPDLHTAPLLPSTPDFFTWMVQPQDDATRIHRLRTHLLAVERDPAFADWLARVFAPAPRDLSALLSSADAENERLRAGWFPDAPAPLFGQPVATTLALHLPTDPEAIARRALALRAEALGDAPA